MKNFLLALLVFCSYNLNAQHTYDSTTLYVDAIATLGTVAMSQQDASVTLGFSPQVGLRVRDASTEIYLEVLGGYNSMTVYPDSMEVATKQYFKNLDVSLGIFVSKIFSIKIGGFYFSENVANPDDVFGGLVSAQGEFPLTDKLLLILSGNIGINFKGGESPYRNLMRGNVGVAYNFLNKGY